MVEGAFIRGDGLVIPNNITTEGAKKILNAATRGGDYNVWIALVRGSFSLGLQIESLIEPAFTNGYSRKALTRSADDWPTLDATNGRGFVQSKLVTFTPSGDFSEYVQRVALVGHATNNVGNVFALSQPLGGDLYIDPDTPLFQRQFAYRIYL